MPNLTTFPSAEAQWIWTDAFDDAAAVGQFVLFRKVFTIHTVPTDAAILHVTADTRYRLYLNGQSISFGPCKSYPSHWYYESVDIRSYLQLGHAIYSDATWKAQQDSSVRIADNSEWDFRLGPDFLSLSERVDGRLSAINWLDNKYDDSQWPTAVIKTATRKMSPMLDARRLFPRDIPFVTEVIMGFDKAVTSSSVVTTEDWTGLLRSGTSLQLQQNSIHTVDIQSKYLTTGFIDFVCEFAGSGAQSPLIEFLYAECYEAQIEPGKPREKDDRTEYRSGELYGPKDTYIPHNGLNHYSPFWWRTFRYVRLTITVRDSPFTLKSFAYRATHYPLSIGVTINTPSLLLTSLWNISLRTLQNCMHETYEDCPFYEQNQFAMDTRSQILFTYLVSRDDRLARKTIREFYASRREDGLVETHFPNPGRSINIPTFSLFWVLMVYDHMVHFGDEGLVKKYIGAVDGVMNYFDERINDLGLIGQFDSDCWAFVDWVDDWATSGKGFLGLAVPRAYFERGSATYHSLLYAYTLLKASELCTFVGRHDTANEYLARQQRLIRAVWEHCYDGSTGFFLDGPGASNELSQHVQVFALLAGCITGPEAKELIRRTILHYRRNKLAKASFAMGFYVYRAASEAGIYEECWEALIQPWEKMIRQNLTTWAESESMVRSDCHGWSATPLYEIGTEILGFTYRNETYLARVSGEERGAQVRISPKMSLAKEIRGSFVVGQEHGDEICVSWDREGHLKLTSTRDRSVQVLGKLGWETRLLQGASLER